MSTTGLSGVNLEVEAAVKATDSISDVVSGMRTTVQAINDQAESAKAYWQGEGNTAFAKTAIEWEEEGRRLNTLLDEIDTKLRDGYKNYETEDADVSSTFSQIGGTLDGKSLNL